MNTLYVSMETFLPLIVKPFIVVYTSGWLSMYLLIVHLNSTVKHLLEGIQSPGVSGWVPAIHVYLRFIFELYFICRCNAGYFSYPYCFPCTCNVNGTQGDVCEVGGGQCPCKPQYQGTNCDQCAYGYYGFPDCQRECFHMFMYNAVTQLMFSV